MNTITLKNIYNKRQLSLFENITYQRCVLFLIISFRR